MRETDMSKRERMGKDHPLFNGGKTKDANGYVVLSSKIHGENAGRREHRVVMEAHLGRSLSISEIVHHKNGIKSDNRIENLEVMGRKEHNRQHALGSELSCSACGAKRFYSPAIAKTLKTPYLCRNCYPERRWEGKHPLSKISKGDANAIRARRSSGERGRDLAKEYGVSESTICDIIKFRKNK